MEAEFGHQICRFPNSQEPAMKMAGLLVLGLMVVMLGVTEAQLTNEVVDTGYVDPASDPHQAYYTGQYNGVYSPYSADTAVSQHSDTDRY